ncbi:hypothetical protein R1sor_014976 [Riccia sorocarpa]|uniref:F-box domain-containing protein n=1 Tax=Riccia sorocarpa TaxID=122646 RepID=A0ABD3HAX2_9MARC
MANGNSFDNISEEVLELVLGKLPTVTVLEAAQVCKSWCSVIRSRRFARYYDSLPCRRSWFFQCLVSFFSENNQGYGYDPESKQWHKFSSKFSLPIEQDRSALPSSPDGAILSIFTLTDLFYKREFLSTKWEVAPAMNYSRNAPLVAVVDGKDNSSHKVIVAGGVAFFEDDDLALEVFDSASGAWEVCESLPREFRNNCSSHWMTSAVAGGKFLVAEMYSGQIAAFDLESKKWSRVGSLRPQGVVHSLLLSCQDSLLLAGSSYSEGNLTFKIWKVNVAAQECGVEIASMPPAFCKNFTCSDESWQDRKCEGLQCVASGNLLYIFSRERQQEGQIVLCDLSSGVAEWSVLPPLPAIGALNHVVGKREIHEEVSKPGIVRRRGLC